MENALHSLRDIEGVLGSFVLDVHGKLLAHDMPSIFDHETLSSASLRLSQLRAAFEANGDGFDGCTARFGSHLLVLRAAHARTLCVLCPLGLNLNTLQMGLNLVARRISAGEDKRSALPAPMSRSSLPPSPLPTMAPISESPPSVPNERAELVPQEPEPSRFFRGRPVR
jgi:hypothetical protein